jgi:GTP-binding protein
LRHIERCAVLVHLVDLSVLTLEEQGDAGQDLSVIEAELRDFDPSLLTRQRVVVGSKIDAAQEDRREALRAAAKDRGLPYLEVSAATRNGLDTLTRTLRRLIDAAAKESDES